MYRRTGRGDKRMPSFSRSSLANWRSGSNWRCSGPQLFCSGRTSGFEPDSLPG
jgi:hypothetical protein